MLPLPLIGRGENRSQSDGSCQGHKHPLDVGVLKPLKPSSVIGHRQGITEHVGVQVLLSKPQQLWYLFLCLLEGEKIISFSQET